MKTDPRLLVIGLLLVVSTMVVATQFAITDIGMEYKIVSKKDYGTRYIGSDNTSDGIRVLRAIKNDPTNAFKIVLGNISNNYIYTYTAAFGIANEENFSIDITHIDVKSINHTYLKIWLHGNRTANAENISNDPTSVFIQPHDREAYYEFLQDEWSFAPDWNMTAGVRHDHYSDFGDTINPRLALVWQTKYNMTSKLLYGHAFRAPSFAELYNINNPVAIGNPELDPETIDTIEIALNVQHTPDLSTGLSLFHYKMSDIIRLVLDNPTSPTTSTSTYQNTGNQTGHGFELEATWDVRKDFTLKGNFAFQDSKDEDTNSDAANAPQKQLYVRADWEFKRDWNLDGQANWVADRKRAAGDTRPEVDDYTTVDVTLRYKPENSPWEFALSGRNIFDEDVREPSPAPGLIPNDLPLAGSSYFVEAGYHL